LFVTAVPVRKEGDNVMERRKFLYAASVGGAAAALPAPAISQGIRELKMVTSWPKGLPGLGGGAERMAKSITAVTGGKIQVKVFGAGEMVKPFEVFDAVSAGVADMYHSAEYYWEAKSPGFCFFAAVPFGFTADELAAWVHFGGGQALWDELSAAFNVKGPAVDQHRRPDGRLVHQGSAGSGKLRRVALSDARLGRRGAASARRDRRSAAGRGNRPGTEIGGDRCQRMGRPLE
jgi:hypothetical protein